MGGVEGRGHEIQQRSTAGVEPANVMAIQHAL